MRICCIDGNIGAGKSTILNELKKRGYLVLEEELSKWGELLNRFYSNPSRWMCTLQIAILHSMHKQYSDLLKLKDGSVKDDIVFIERSPQSSMIFVKNGINQGFLDVEEKLLITNIFDLLHWKPHSVFFLKTSVDICFKRMNRRARECEKGVTKEYLDYLEKEYLNLYNDQNSIMIDDDESNVMVDKILLKIGN